MRRKTVTSFVVAALNGLAFAGVGTGAVAGPPAEASKATPSVSQAQPARPSPGPGGPTLSPFQDPWATEAPPTPPQQSGPPMPFQDPWAPQAGAKGPPRSGTVNTVRR